MCLLKTWYNSYCKRLLLTKNHPKSIGGGKNHQPSPPLDVLDVQEILDSEAWQAVYMAASSISRPLLTKCVLIALILLFILFRWPISEIPISLKSPSRSLATFSRLLIFAAWNASTYFSMLINLSHSSTDWNSGGASFSELEKNNTLCYTIWVLKLGATIMQEFFEFFHMEGCNFPH